MAYRLPAPQKKLFTSNSGGSKKREPPMSHSRSPKSIRLNSYISLEKKRYRSSELPFSESDFDLAISCASNTSLNTNDRATPKTLYFAIGSPESVVGLQRVLKAQRTNFAVRASRAATFPSQSVSTRANPMIGNIPTISRTFEFQKPS